MHILVIEPDRVQAKTYAEALTRKGHEVRVVSSAQSAIFACDQQEPDVVTLELQLPGHNGVEFLYEFRSYPEWAHIPVVLHTFVSPAELTNAAVLRHELGIANILYKPKTSLEHMCGVIGAMQPTLR